MIERLSSNDLMSKITVWNRTAYLSGQVALDNREGDLKVQAREIFSRIDALLDEVGTGKSNLLAATIWLTDVDDFQAFNDLWRKWIGADAPPARAAVRAGLMLPGLRLEIQVIAAIP